jgi:hypothetical protein
LVRLTLDHVQRTLVGRRIFIGRTGKRQRPAAIPVTPLMEEIID